MKISIKQKIHKYLLYIKWFITEDLWYFLSFKKKRSKFYRILKATRKFRLKSRGLL